MAKSHYQFKKRQKELAKKKKQEEKRRRKLGIEDPEIEGTELDPAPSVGDTEGLSTEDLSNDSSENTSSDEREE